MHKHDDNTSTKATYTAQMGNVSNSQIGTVYLISNTSLIALRLQLVFNSRTLIHIRNLSYRGLAVSPSPNEMLQTLLLLYIRTLRKIKSTRQCKCLAIV